VSRRRHLRNALLALLLLGAAAAGGGCFLLRTTGGARWLAARILRREPRLALHVESGSLWRGLHLREVSWHDGANRFTLAVLDARWSIALSPRPAVRFHRLHLDGLQLDLEPAPAPVPVPASPHRLHLPLEVDIADFRLREARLALPGFTAQLADAALSGHFSGDRLVIHQARLADFHLHDQRPAPEPAPDLPWFEALAPERRSPVVLPDLQIPVDVVVQDFSLARASYARGTEVQTIHALDFAAELLGQDLTLHRFRLAHDQVQIEARGTLQLAGDYPLALAIQARSETLLPPRALGLEAALSNCVANLAFNLRLEGPAHLHVHGRIQPLEPALPFDAVLAWRQLAWPLTGAATVSSDAGKMELRGSLAEYALTVAAELAGPAIPAGRWQLAGRGDLRHLVLEPLAGEVLGGHLRLAGPVSWTNGLAWQLAVQAENLEAAALHPEAPTSLTLQAETTGRWDSQAWELNLALAAAAAEWRGWPLTARGQLSGSSAHGWSTPGLELAVQDNAVHLAGAYAADLDLAGTLDLRDLSQLLPDGTGHFTGRWTLRGPLALPDITIAGQAAELAWGDLIRVDSAKFDLHLAALGQAQSRAEFAFESLRLPERDLAVDSLRLAAGGTRARHRVEVESTGGEASLAFALTGECPEASRAWQGALERAALAVAGFDWTLAGPLPLHWDPDAQQLVAAPHRWLHAGAELRADEPLRLGAHGAARLRLSGFDLAEFQPWLPADLRVDGRLAAAAALRWAPGQPPQADLSLDLQEAGLRLVVTDEIFIDDAPPLSVAFDTATLHAQLAENRLAAEFELASGGLGSIRAAAQARVVPAAPGLAETSGSVVVEQFQLDILRPFLPALRTLSGQAGADLRFSGDLRRPLLHGTVHLTRGILEPAALPVTLGDIQLRGDLHGDRATLAGGFRSGQGRATLAGEMVLRDDAWQATLHLAGERLELAYGTLAVLQASPDLHLTVVPGRLDLTGVVRIPQADILLQPLPETAVRTSEDVVFENGRPEEPAPAPAAAGWARDIHLDLEFGDRIALGGLGITGRLAGNLRLRQVDDLAPTAFGELRIEDGRYRAYGQRLQIRRGQLLFAGPLDRPNLALEAFRDVPLHNVVAGLRVEGPPDALQSSLFSEPEMPEEDILAFLLLGRPLVRDETGDNRAMLARAALALGLARGGAPAASLAENLGVENLQLDTAGEGDDTQVVVSGMVSPRLQLSYGVGLFVPANTLTLRYQLARQLFLEASSGLESALDLLYTFRF
jgi:translocation and assembly module TamB